MSRGALISLRPVLLMAPFNVGDFFLFGVWSGPCCLDGKSVSLDCSRCSFFLISEQCNIERRLPRYGFLARFISGVVLAPCMCAHDSGTNFFHRVGQKSVFADQRGFGQLGDKVSNDRRPKGPTRKRLFLANATAAHC